MPERIMAPKRFRAWLESQPEDWKFARGDCGFCAIALYLEDQTGREPRVTGESYRLDDSRRKPLPPWARRYIKWLDADRGNTKAAAIRVLDRVTTMHEVREIS